jgi:hypothetical protein
LLNIDEQTLKNALKQALIESFEERRDSLQEIMCQALEDFAMIQAIGEGLNTPLTSADEVKRILKDSA